MIGIIVYKWYNNNGKFHHLKILNSYYVPEGNFCLLSPQHWCNQYGSSIRSREGTDNTTTASKTVLFLNGDTNKLDIFLEDTYSFANLYLAPVNQ